MLEAATPSAERIENVDVLRGMALLGVLLVNAVTLFRMSLFLYLELFHADSGVLNHAVDWFLAMVVESKSFALFSLLFGVGSSIFLERAARHVPHPSRLHARRLFVLFAIGLAHLTLVWNGDILTAYALVGLAVLPLVGWRPRVSLAVAVAIGVLYCFPLPFPDVRPHGSAALRHGATAARVYASGSWLEIFEFRSAETRAYILPLLATMLPRVAALFLLGDWSWRRGIWRAPNEHRVLLRTTTVLGFLVGGSNGGRRSCSNEGLRARKIRAARVFAIQRAFGARLCGGARTLDGELVAKSTRSGVCANRAHGAHELSDAVGGLEPDLRRLRRRLVRTARRNDDGVDWRRIVRRASGRQRGVATCVPVWPVRVVVAIAHVRADAANAALTAFVSCARRARRLPRKAMPTRPLRRGAERSDLACG